MTIELIATFIGGVATTLIPFLFARKKSNAETITTEIENAQKVVAMQREMMEYIKAELLKVQQDNTNIMDEFKKLSEIHEDVLKELHGLKTNYAKLEKSYKELKNKISENYEK